MLKSRSSEVTATPVADINSNLLPQLFERLVVGKQLQVLDLCGARSATVDLFSNFKCRLFITNLLDEEFVTTPDEEASHEQLVAQFRAALALPEECKLNLCLFWDIFNYLDGPALRAFLEALEPYVGENTRIFALGVLNARTQLPNYSYAIRHLAQIQQSPGRIPQLPVYQYSQRELNGLLDYLEIDKSRLLSDGRLEYILCRSQGAKRSANSIFGF